jgi:cell fate regulator YaaT (PSP1 superfamily)
MEAEEYLASFGRNGLFGRFRTLAPLHLRRGERVVVRGARGIEIAEVLRPATPRHAHFLPNTSIGQLLRRLTPADEECENAMRLRAQQIFERSSQLAAEMGLPITVLDVEVLLDGEHAVLYQLRKENTDVQPFVNTLSCEFAVHLTLVDLGRDCEGVVAEEGEEPAGCGRPNCGRRADGGCSTCGSGGCGSCGSAQPKDIELYFAQRRQEMERRRMALL